MSRVPSQPDQDDTIFLAIQFQGLEITVRGPSTRALEFAQQLSPQDRPLASTPLEPDPLPPCPDNLLALATRLSAASILTPLDRIKRAWTLGCAARRNLDGEACPELVSVSIDLPANYCVVLRGHGVAEPKVLRSLRDFNRILEGAELPGVGQAFPSETEARVYLAAAGRGASNDR